MDRTFGFLKAGFRTQQLTNMQFVNCMRCTAIRFSKAGSFQVRRGAAVCKFAMNMCIRDRFILYGGAKPQPNACMMFNLCLTSFSCMVLNLYLTLF
jgi:hypothetical protein